MENDNLSILNQLALDDGAQIVDAIRTGGVDAFVVEEHNGHAVYTLNNSDLPYSALVQRMQQGAAMLDSRAYIVYCNPSLATLLSTSDEAMVGVRFEDLIMTEDRPAFQKLLEKLQEGAGEAELRLRRFDQTVLPARLSLSTLSRDGSVNGILVSDLTSEKSHAELASRIQKVEDEERKKIARELHDSVGQLLVALGMNLTRLRTEAPELPAVLMDLLSDSENVVDEVSREIRTISHLLHPPLLDVAGLTSAIHWYVDGFSHRSKIKVVLETDSDLGRLPADVEICLFRVVQECLTNVYRHSGSDFCSISMRHDGQSLYLEVRDTGHGIPTDGKGQMPTGVGLLGMKERLRRISGTLEIRSSENGTVVTVAVPVAGKPQA
ncbi:MAG TPA: histidine kinase [Verrucomicrobiae bacterium]|nr:histidine kinase [Verrucomicrobiae bacterium]